MCTSLCVYMCVCVPVCACVCMCVYVRKCFAAWAASRQHLFHRAEVDIEGWPRIECANRKALVCLHHNEVILASASKGMVC